MQLSSARPRRRGWKSALTLIPVAVMTLAATVTGTLNAEAAVPPTPSGFTLTWSDDFNGASGTGIDQSLWKYDTGPGSNFGTGEIETMTNSTSNVYYDGQGHLVLQAQHSGSDPRGGWTSGRVETQSAAFGAPAGESYASSPSSSSPTSPPPTARATGRRSGCSARRCATV